MFAHYFRVSLEEIAEKYGKKPPENISPFGYILREKTPRRSGKTEAGKKNEGNPNGLIKKKPRGIE